MNASCRIGQRVSATTQSVFFTMSQHRYSYRAICRLSRIVDGGGGAGYAGWDTQRIRGERGMDEKRELVRRTMRIVKEIFRKGMGAVPYCKGNMEWRFNHMSGYGLYCSPVRKALQECAAGGRQIRHHEYHVQTITEQVRLVSGLFCIVSSRGEENSPGVPYEILVCMTEGQAECVHVYGGREARLLCRVRGLCEEDYFLEEGEVYYIESSHNNVIWHCRGYRVEGRDSLKRLEQWLPEEFLRIHRGYIVNVGQIRRIRGNEVHMSNGDVLYIPLRNSVKVRKSLLARMEKGFLSRQETHSSRTVEQGGPDSVCSPL